MNNGYKEKYEPGNHLAAKNGLVYEHRLAGEQKLGRPLKKGEIVHHEDLNRSNNDPKNIIVFRTSADHARYHASGLLEYQQDGAATSPGISKPTCDICGERTVEGFRCKKHRFVYNTHFDWPKKEELVNLVKSSGITRAARQLHVSRAKLRRHLIKENITVNLHD